MLDDYEKLTDLNKREFQDVINALMNHSYIIRKPYSFKQNADSLNAEFIFIERNIDVINEYLCLLGYHVTLDQEYGVAYFDIYPVESRKRLDKISTLVLFTLRLIYEEEKEKLTLSQNVGVTIASLLDKLRTLGISGEKPMPDSALAPILRTLADYNVIQRSSSDISDKSNVIIINPSILFVVNYGELTELETKIRESKESSNEEIDQAIVD